MGAASIRQDEGTEDADENSVAPPAKGKKERDDRERVSPTIREIQTDEEKSLRDWLLSLGPAGSIRVQVTRIKPETVWDPATGQEVNCSGHLTTFDDSFDEEFLKKELGGGEYRLKITKRGPDGSYRYEKGKGYHRTMKIAGEPRLDKLPGIQRKLSPPATAAQPESASLAKAALETMERTMDRTIERERAQRSDEMSPAMRLMIDGMTRQLETKTAELAELRSEMAQIRVASSKPADRDPIMDQLLRSAIDGNSGQVEALRLRQESELRQVKESSLAEVKRIEDRHERQLADMRSSHDNAMNALRNGFEREIAAIRSAHEVALVASRTSSDVQAKTLEAEIRRLTSSNDELRREVQILREKKDKSMVDMIKDVNLLKEMIGSDDDGGEKSGWGAIANAFTPENISAAVSAASAFKNGGAAAAQAQAQAAPPVRPRVVKTPDGQHFVQTAQGLVPARRKPKVVTVTGPDGQPQPIEIPAVDPADIAKLVQYLEAAYGNGIEPEVVAQSGRALVPQDVLAWIKEHDTEQQPGVDLFMSKVAKLSGSSPLSSQGGKNWIRKVGRALIG